jgi:hypothetical protein
VSATGLTEADIVAVLKAFRSYADRNGTYQRRTLQACLKEVGLLNQAMMVCYAARETLARVGLLGQLAAIFERQEAVWADIQESFQLMADNAEFLSKTMKEVQAHPHDP